MHFLQLDGTLSLCVVNEYIPHYIPDGEASLIRHSSHSGPRERDFLREQQR